jgi:hypothetical protein
MVAASPGKHFRRIVVKQALGGLRFSAVLVVE